MNTPTQPPKGQRPSDPLLQRYQEANAKDDTRPSPALRNRVLAHAQTMAQQHNAPETASRPAAANDGAWKLRALGGLAILGLVGLLVLPFDRRTPEEQATAWGPSSQPTDEGRSAPALDAEPSPSLDKPSASASAPRPAENGPPSQASATPADRLAERQAVPAPPLLPHHTQRALERKFRKRPSKQDSYKPTAPKNKTAMARLRSLRPRVMSCWSAVWTHQKQPL